MANRGCACLQAPPADYARAKADAAPGLEHHHCLGAKHAAACLSPCRPASGGCPACRMGEEPRHPCSNASCHPGGWVRRHTVCPGPCQPGCRSHALQTTLPQGHLHALPACPQMVHGGGGANVGSRKGAADGISHLQGCGVKRGHGHVGTCQPNPRRPKRLKRCITLDISACGGQDA